LVHYHDDDPGSSSSPTTPRSSQHLCPNLEHLYIWPCVDLDSFRKMVSSRWTVGNNHDCKCKKLEFVGAGFPHGDDLIGFERELREHRVSAKLEKLAEDSVVCPPCDLC
jgi:hypothetical protein